MIELRLRKLPGPALCAESDPEKWFPTSETPEAARLGHDGDIVAQRTTAQAKEICGRCTIRVACLAEAMEKPERFGIWGGLTVKERNRLAKRSAK